MLPEDNALICGGGRRWAKRLAIGATRANRLKDIVFKAPNSNLELSRWRLAMDKLVREVRPLLGLSEALLWMVRLLTASQQLKRPGEDGYKPRIDSSERGLRLLRRSLAKVLLELPNEIRVWNNIINSVRSALDPRVLYGILETGLLNIGLRVNEFKQDSYRVPYIFDEIVTQHRLSGLEVGGRIHHSLR